MCFIFIYFFYTDAHVSKNERKKHFVSARLVSSRLVREIWKLLVNFYAAPKPLAPSPAPSPSPSSCLSAATPLSLLLPPAVFRSVILAWRTAASIASAMAQIWNPSGMLRAVNQNQRGKLFQRSTKNLHFFFFSMARFTSLPLSLTLSLCQWRGWSGLRSACWPDWKQIKNEI